MGSYNSYSDRFMDLENQDQTSVRKVCSGLPAYVFKANEKTNLNRDHLIAQKGLD